MKENTKLKKSFLDTFLSNNALISLAVILLGFFVGTILLLIVGKNPGGMYKAILDSLIGVRNSKGVWNIRNIGESLAYSVPFILCGLSMAFAARVGLFNIGAEGQYIMGFAMAQLFAVSVKPFPGQWIVCLLIAALTGAVWGGIVGILKACFQVSEVVATIMLNYIGLWLARMLCLACPNATTFNVGETLPATACLKKIFITNSNLNTGFFFMIISVILFWYIMEKTSLGFEMRATGFNKEAARCSGIPVVKSIALSMAISGVFAGLAGAIVLLGGAYPKGHIVSTMHNYGFNGIAVALVGNNTAIGTFLAGLLFGVLKQGQSIMQNYDIPKEITFIIQGLIVVFISLRSGLEIVRQMRSKKVLQMEISEK